MIDFRSSKYLMVLSSFIGLAYCSSEDRLIAGTKACGLRPVIPEDYRTLNNLEYILAQTRLTEDDVDEIYNLLRSLIEFWEEEITPPSISKALEQLMRLSDLETHNCLDYCTYILAQNNCYAAIRSHACRPRSPELNLIKSIIDAKVLPMIGNCQVPLMWRSLDLNKTISNSLYQVVKLIKDRLTYFEPTEKWKTIDEMMLKSRRPFTQIRRLTQFTLSGFKSYLLVFMQELEALSGGIELDSALSTFSLTLDGAIAHYERLIKQPCQQFIDLMHTSIDATLFYGRIIELNRHGFNLDYIDDNNRLRFYELLHIYHACTYVDEKDTSDLFIVQY